MPDKLVGYDCRCRSWYQNQTKDLDYTLMQDPYVAANNISVYFSITQYMRFASGMPAVNTLDLNLNNFWFEESITKYLNNSF